MNYELSNLETLCTKLASKEEMTGISKIEVELIKEVEVIKKAWRVASCMHNDAIILQNYVRQHQLSLISICSQIQRFAGTNSNLFKHMEEMHLFLIEAFSDFLDMNITIPDYSLPATKQNLKGKLPELEAFFKLLEISENLTRAIFSRLNDWLEQNDMLLIPYYRLRFFLNLDYIFNELINSKIPEAKSTDILVNRLCHINYNSFAVYEAIKDLIKTQAATKGDAQSQLDFLRGCLLHFKHLPVRSDVYYKPDNRIMARSLSDWLKGYINARENELHKISEEELFESDVENTTKIMTSLSIEELALLTRLSIESGVIKIKKNGLSALARLMSHNVRTLTKGIFDEYKPETFYKYYYSISTVTSQSVQSILKRMLRKMAEVEKLIKNAKAIPSAQSK